MNWSHALDAFSLLFENDRQFRDEFVRSLYGQCRFIAANLETDVRGNHLLKNLRALIWGGVVFEGDAAHRWLEAGLRLLRIEIEEQVLPDGGHFERAPGYHMIVLRDVLETAEFLRRNREVPLWLLNAQARMLDFLDAILPENGRLPLFKDTALTDDPPPLAFFDPESAYARLIFGGPHRIGERKTRPSTEFLEASGYAITRSPRHYFMIDVGKPCPDYLPAHTHADMFSYELTIDGAIVVADSGVYEYAEGEWRDWFRSTRAHNTVEVADANQSEVWGSFRVGRRATPSNVKVTTDGDVTMVQGDHDGYQRLDPPVRHRRTVASTDGLWIVIDELFGDGRTSGVSRIHILRDVEIAVAAGLITRERGWYSPRFGEKRENVVWALSADGDLPLRIAYAISCEGLPRLTVENDRVDVSTPRRHLSVRLD